MIRMTVSAIALTLAATTATAQSDSSDESVGTEMEADQSGADMQNMDSANLIRTRDITDGNVYTVDADGEAPSMTWDEGTTFDAVNEEWELIGEIEDIVLTRNGEVTGIVAEVGGFLDVGDKHVMINVDEMKLVPVDDQTYGYVTQLTEEQLEDREGVDEGFWN
ncbi:hypothetical protein OCH239_09880 [Roseivivax halodurans JCM 10272]|uniref:PRC-barrel domain-containing protein n=1 Tax=Roseivivax halodurans JCM 10272 TaxID=1449350 RepID=X7EBW2_9RHOB|nr:PRC-barrel domain-containing protein [Roseivivax halodurans]ETX13579.1 hypothetical protein OCH239_09880 [Roseivivax halodurans JCM 10272]